MLSTTRTSFGATAMNRTAYDGHDGHDDHDDDDEDLDSEHPQPYLCEDKDNCALHFDYIAIQSEMRRAQPNELVLGYTRTMMAFLLFNPQPSSIAMIGLGGGSLAKYCHLRLPEARISVIEINPKVIALRSSFMVPKDSARFEIICMDGAQYVREVNNPCDVLLVDGFDVGGQPPQLCSQRFYDDCYRRLTAGGVAAINLLDSDGLDENLWRLKRSFDNAVVLGSSEDNLNRIAFAYKGNIGEVIEQQMALRQKSLEANHPVNLRRSAQAIRRGWVKALAER